MYVVVEFGGEEANKTAVVRREWLTPKKREVFWPPYKLSSQFAKALTEGTCPNEEHWTLYPVVRCLYSSDNLLKARQKEGEAEKESDLQTEPEEGCTRQRKRRRIIFSSSEEEDDFRPTTSKSLQYPKFKPTARPTQSISRPTSHNLETTNNSASTSSIEATPKGSRNLSQTPVPTLSSSQSDIITNSGFNVIAGVLSKLELEIASIKEYLEDFLPRLLNQNNNTTAKDVSRELLPPLPCKNREDVEALEEWLIDAENQDLLVQYFSRIGGRTLEYIVKKILERLFTNELAQMCNWTGKHNKLMLKDLRVLGIIYRVVRSNSETAKASECEITLKLRSWFRFAKDREGGREERRKKN